MIGADSALQNAVARRSGLSEQRRVVLRAFLLKHGLTPKEVGRRGGFNPNAIYNFLNRISGSLSAGTLERVLSAVPGATADDLLVPAPPGQRGEPSPCGNLLTKPQRHSRRTKCQTLFSCQMDGMDVSDPTMPPGPLPTKNVTGKTSFQRRRAIAEAKARLGATFGVPEGRVEIMIRE